MNLFLYQSTLKPKWSCAKKWMVVLQPIDIFFENLKDLLSWDIKVNADSRPLKLSLHHWIYLVLMKSNFSVIFVGEEAGILSRCWRISFSINFFDYTYWAIIIYLFIRSWKTVQFLAMAFAISISKWSIRSWMKGFRYCPKGKPFCQIFYFCK